MEYTTIIGTFGALLILIAFILNQLDIWKGSYFIYDFLNLIGSLLMVIYAYLLASIPFLILNTIWAILSLRDSIIDLIRNSKKQDKSFIKKWLY